MTHDRNRTWLPVAIIAGSLLAWGGFLALGAYRAEVGSAAGGDSRKLLVVAATTLAFVLLWGLVLAIRQWKLRKQRESDEA